MSHAAGVLLRVPLVVLFAWAVLATVAPAAMTRYEGYQIGQGVDFGCARIQRTPSGPFIRLPCPTVAETHRLDFGSLMADGALRSMALLAGASVLAIVVGGLLGASAALLRRRAVASGLIVAATSLIAAVPSFFAAYFLQMTVIVMGTAAGGRILPVFGFGYDEHLVLPLLSISIPAVAYTAQLTAARMQEVLDADFVRTADAKGLLGSWVLRVHVLPHVRPVLLEAVGSGLRVSVASLPIVEFLFNWNGIGYFALEAVALRDPAAFVFCAVVLASVFALLGAIADLSRPRALFRAAGH